MNPIQDSSSWIFVGEEGKLRENHPNLVFPKGLSVLLIKKSGRYYAISGKCAHMACSMGGGTLNDYVIQCPCHDWRYDIRTGEFLDAKEITLATYPCREADGKIYIRLTSQEGDRS
jgi:nitrite reductase/ring-hydroxylating ferredoxin subunit